MERHPEPNQYLRARRKAAGFTLTTFADAIGLSERQLSRIELTGAGSLRSYVLAAKVLGCTVDDLVPDELRLAPVPGARAEWRLPPR